MSINTQFQVKKNAEDMREYLKDLYSWEESVNKKKKVQKKVETNIPIRGNCAEQERQEKELQKQAKKNEIFEFQDNNKQKDLKYKRDANTVQDYYKAWDKFDVDQELEIIDGQQIEKNDIQKVIKDKKDVPKPNTKIMIKGGKSNTLSEINSIKDKVFFKQKANLFFTNTNYQQAIDLYSQCLDILDQHDNSNEEFKMKAIILSNRAQCHLNLNNYADCIRDCQQSLESYDKHVKSFLRLGMAQRKMNHLKNSIISFQKGLLLEPENQILKKELEITQKILDKKRQDFKNGMIKNQRNSTFESQIVSIRDTEQVQEKETQQNKENLQSQINQETKNNSEKKNIETNKKEKSQNLEQHDYVKQKQNFFVQAQEQKVNDVQPEIIDDFPQITSKESLTKEQEFNFENLLGKLDSEKNQIIKNNSTQLEKPRVSFPDNLVEETNNNQNYDLDKAPQKSILKKQSTDSIQNYKVQSQEKIMNEFIPESQNQQVQQLPAQQNQKQEFKNIVTPEILQQAKTQQLHESKITINSQDFKKKYQLFKNQPDLQLEFLQQFDPANLKNIFQQDLDPDLFVSIMNVLHSNYENHQILAKSYMIHFLETVRFKICLKSLIKKEKAGRYFYLELKQLLARIGDSQLSQQYQALI